jgi:hypothetical protein
MRREARRLNAALGVPVPPPTRSQRRPKRQGTRAKGSPAQSPAVRERRFARASGRPDPVPSVMDGEPDEVPISEGARLMITNLATAGTSREEILGLMRDELGLENADAILDRLIL